MLMWLVRLLWLSPRWSLALSFPVISVYVRTVRSGKTEDGAESESISFNV
jgi:hypothetical protein